MTRGKWEAWNEVKGMSRSQAQNFLSQLRKKLTQKYAGPLPSRYIQIGQTTAEKGVQAKSGSEEDILSLKKTVAALKKVLASVKQKNDPLKLFTSDIFEHGEKFKFYTGLKIEQFNTIFEFLGGENIKLNYWNGEKQPRYIKFKVDNKTQLLLTVVRMRLGYTLQDMSYRFKIRVTSLRSFFVTWVQTLYFKFQDIKKNMFVSREIHHPLPEVFRNQLLNKTRIVIDATEFFVEGSSNYTQQGHLYSSYKGHTTGKVLIGIAPSGILLNELLILMILFKFSFEISPCSREHISLFSRAHLSV